MNRRYYAYIAIFVIILALIFNAPKWGHWLFLALFVYFAICLIAAIVKIVKKQKNNIDISKREFLLKLTALLMCLCFVSGTVIFSFAFERIGSTRDVVFNNTELILRSMICSLDMFMLDVDSNILDRLDKAPLLKGLIVVQATLSFICTIILLVCLIFSRVKAYYLLHVRTKITSEKNHLYIFFGLNENSRLLARDIHDKDPKSIIIYIDEASINNEDNDSWDNVKNLFVHKQSTFELAEESKSLVAIASHQLSDLNVDKSEGEDIDILSMIGLDKIRDLINDLETTGNDGQLHIFFLSENEDNNISNLINLAKDAVILSVAHNDVIEERIYCHARYTGANRAIEDLAARKGINVEIVDSSHLAVELLKAKKIDQPVRVAQLSGKHPTSVEHPIESLIVGFGEVGRDAFRFIYEFGTFITFINNRPKIAYPKITAIDSRMKELNGAFLSNAPAIKPQDGKIEFKQMDCNSVTFFSSELSKEKCKSLNYIVLALGDDDQNMTLAVDIFNRIRRYREDMSHLIIMVRSLRDDKYEMMQKIADHYNKGCGVNNLNIIRLFGSPKEIYSYKTIIRDSLTKKGMRFMENYLRLRNEKYSWKKRREKLSGIFASKEGESGLPNIDKLRTLRRQESQDLANALHSETKMWLLHQALGKDCDWDSFLCRLFDIDGIPSMLGSKTGIHYPHLSARENEIMLNLAMLEHARWNSAHEILGYEANSEGCKCDECKMTHNCLVNWEDLDAASERASTPDWECDYKIYDFGVVNTSIALSKELNNSVVEE